MGAIQVWASAGHLTDHILRVKRGSDESRSLPSSPVMQMEKLSAIFARMILRHWEKKKKFYGVIPVYIVQYVYYPWPTSQIESCQHSQTTECLRMLHYVFTPSYIPAGEVKNTRLHPFSQRSLMIWPCKTIAKWYNHIKSGVFNNNRQ